jgi:hypothetical protein
MFTGTLLWVIALTALLLWPLQNAQHEGMHAFMAKHYGAEITKMVLWPSDADDKLSVAFWKPGFTWAHVQWKGGDYDDAGRARISIAPQATNTVVLVGLGLVRFLINPSELVVSLLAGWALVNFVDGAVNLATFYRPEPDSKHTDGWSFQHRAGVNKWVCRVGTVGWHLGFGAMLFLLW